MFFKSLKLLWNSFLPYINNYLPNPYTIQSFTKIYENKSFVPVCFKNKYYSKNILKLLFILHFILTLKHFFGINNHIKMMKVWKVFEMKVAIYARVSTTKDQSCERQILELREIAENHNCCHRCWNRQICKDN